MEQLTAGAPVQDSAGFAAIKPAAWAGVALPIKPIGVRFPPMITTVAVSSAAKRLARKTLIHIS
jgi:hypothetical protein